MIKHINIIKNNIIKRLFNKPKCFGYLCFPYGCIDELICDCTKECKYKKITENLKY